MKKKEGERLARKKRLENIREQMRLDAAKYERQSTIRKSIKMNP